MASSRDSGKVKLKALKSTSTSIKSFVELSEDTKIIAESVQRPRPKKEKTRKELRKFKRQKRKAKHHQFWIKNKVGNVDNGLNGDKKSAVATVNKILEEKIKKKRKRKSQVSKKKEDTISDQNLDIIEDLLSANKKEDKIIASLGKKLKLDKKKKVSSAFESDGLNYLLELCETPIGEAPGFYKESDEELDDIPDEQSSKIKHVVKEKKLNVEISEKKNKEAEESHFDHGIFEDADDMEDEENGLGYTDYSDNDNEKEDLPDEESSDEEEEEDSPDEKTATSTFPERVSQSEILKRKSMNNIESISSKKRNTDKQFQEKSEFKEVKMVERYIPPHLRNVELEQDSKRQQQLEKLRKRLKGLLNRLSESNLTSISQEIEELYTQHSRNDMNMTLTKLILDVCVMPSHMPEKLLMENVMLISILHARIGNEVGAFFIETLVEKFDTLHSSGANYGLGKECDNAAILICHLYNFKVVDSTLVYDIIRELVKTFTERDIDMLMSMLKTIGPEIRRDDPGALKDIILEIQTKAASCSELQDKSRVRFMLEIITALRNNNLRKIPQYNPSLVEHAKKILKQVLHTTKSIDDLQLKISLEDLRHVKERGRWWIVGSAWSVRGPANVQAVSSGGLLSGGCERGGILELAKKQRMNTDVRKKVFCVIMTSEDYLDAFEKLLKLGLKDKQAREIVHVLIDCCLQENNYNPYYAVLGQKLCEYSRGNQVTFQYSFWDQFKVIPSLPAYSVINMAHLLAHLFASQVLSLSILKVVNFGTLDKESIKFFTKLFSILLLEHPESTLKSVFSRIASLPKLSLLQAGLKIFLRHFLLPRTKRKDTPDVKRLEVLVGMAEASLERREYTPL